MPSREATPHACEPPPPEPPAPVPPLPVAEPEAAELFVVDSATPPAPPAPPPEAALGSDAPSPPPPGDVGASEEQPDRTQARQAARTEMERAVRQCMGQSFTARGFA